MRDVDFLPNWYPAIQRRHRMVVVQAWASAAVLVALAGYAGAKSWEVHTARRTAAVCEAQLSMSRQQLTQLHQKMLYQDQLKHQDDIVAKLGIGVDATRMLTVLEDAMTPEMALTSLSTETIEAPRVVQAGAPVRRRASGETTVELDRRMQVKVEGIAPNDLDTAMLIARLNEVKFMENVACQYLREGRTRDGSVVREFEITFEVGLNPPGGN